MSFKEKIEKYENLANELDQIHKEVYLAVEKHVFNKHGEGVKFHIDIDDGVSYNIIHTDKWIEVDLDADN